MTKIGDNNIFVSIFKLCVSLKKNGKVSEIPKFWIKISRLDLYESQSWQI